MNFFDIITPRIGEDFFSSDDCLAVSIYCARILLLGKEIAVVGCRKELIRKAPLVEHIVKEVLCVLESKSEVEHIGLLRIESSIINSPLLFVG